MIGQVDYEVGGREAHRYDLGGGEFLRVEVYVGYFSIAWSTCMPIAAVLGVVEPLLRSVSGQVVAFDEQTNAHVRPDPAEEGLTRLLARDAAFSFARLELPELTLVWEQPHPADQAHAPSPGELAVLVRVFDEDALVRMLRGTATALVANEAQRLIRRIAWVAEHVARGRLGSSPAQPIA